MSNVSAKRRIEIATKRQKQRRQLRKSYMLKQEANPTLSEFAMTQWNRFRKMGTAFQWACGIIVLVNVLVVVSLSGQG